MMNTLADISGLEIKRIPYELAWVGDLLFFDWSIISVLQDTENKPFIKSWIESKNGITRLAIFEVDKHLLENYIFGLTSYLDVFLNPVNDLIFIIDSNNEQEIVSTKILSKNYLPKKYIPKKHILFDREDSINVDKIIETFNLVNTDNLEQPYTFDILDESLKIDHELINLHLSSQNEKVGYGRVESQTLGEILLGYNKLAEATAINIFENSSTITSVKNLHHKKDTIAYIKKLATTEYTYDKAASFSVFLTPTKIIKDQISNETSSEKILNKIFNLFSIGYDVNQLEKHNTSFSSGMISAFSQFLRSVRDNDITVTVQYGNPQKKSSNREVFTSKKSEQIIKNLTSLERGDPIESKIQGKFTLLDTDNYKFRFLSFDNVSFEGKFDKRLNEYVARFNLEDNYDIGVVSVWENKIGGESKSSHTITFCMKITPKNN